MCPRSQYGGRGGDTICQGSEGHGLSDQVRSYILEVCKIEDYSIFIESFDKTDLDRHVSVASGELDTLADLSGPQRAAIGKLKKFWTMCERISTELNAPVAKLPVAANIPVPDVPLSDAERKSYSEKFYAACNRQVPLRRLLNDTAPKKILNMIEKQHHRSFSLSSIQHCDEEKPSPINSMYDFITRLDLLMIGGYTFLGCNDQDYTNGTRGFYCSWDTAEEYVRFASRYAFENPMSGRRKPTLAEIRSRVRSGPS